MRVKEGEPGRSLPPEQAPELWALTADVARRVGTRPIEAIYITPGTEIAVTERGSLPGKLMGRGQRCLILGLGVLPEMQEQTFKAILAHEYGHFSNRDTAGGNLALQIQRSIYLIAQGLAERGQARLFNPVWLFLRGFHQIYLRITLGASRLQEILADRYAALAYGTQPLVDGLTHVVRQSMLFDRQAGHELETAVHTRRGLQNLYTLPETLSEGQERELEAELAKELSRPTSAFDSHPAMQDRIALLRRLAVPTVVDGEGRLVVELLPTLVELQSEMTAAVQANLSRVRLS
jgi:Zn-dependent protease with chaperone function